MFKIQFPARVALAMSMATILPLAEAMAQDAEPTQRLVVELNAAQTTDEGSCAFSFLVTNGLADPIEALVLEAVLFDAGGQVERLTLFDFGALPAGRPRVRQFVVSGAACTGFGSVLLNGVQTCKMAGAEPAVCEDALEVRSRGRIDLVG